MKEAAFTLADYLAIRMGSELLRVEDTRERCLQSHRWLESQIIPASPPLIVVTHHAPVPSTANANLVRPLSSASSHNDFTHLLRSPVQAWIHGHHHGAFENRINGIPVLSNLRGYRGENLCCFSRVASLQMRSADLLSRPRRSG